MGPAVLSTKKARGGLFSKAFVLVPKMGTVYNDRDLPLLVPDR